MELDKHITEVFFRVERHKDYKGQIFALLPYEISSGYYITCYSNGGHSSADYRSCIANSKPASKQEYENLYNQMRQLGYNLKVVDRQVYNKYLKAYYNSKN